MSGAAPLAASCSHDWKSVPLRGSRVCGGLGTKRTSGTTRRAFARVHVILCGAHCGRLATRAVWRGMTEKFVCREQPRAPLRLASGVVRVNWC
jgi:hypothetical protein